MFNPHDIFVKHFVAKNLRAKIKYQLNTTRKGHEPTDFFGSIFGLTESIMILGQRNVIFLPKKHFPYFTL